MFNVETVRQDFPMLQGKLNEGQPLVYLDNGATTLKPTCVAEAVNHYYTEMTANAHRGDYEIAMKVDQAYEHTRETIARLINCQSKEVVFTSGATEGLNTIAFGYAKPLLKPGDVILLNYHEHASNVLPWFAVAKETGAVIRYIDLTEDGRITVENVEKALDDKVKIVSVAAITNVLGYKAPVKEICSLAHQYGAKVVVDGAQSVPHMPTDVQEWDCDFLAFSAHKMCGPTGAGVLYGKYDLLQQANPFTYGGGSNARFNANGEVILKDAPFKFESGTQPIEGVIGLNAAAEYLMNIGLDNIREYEMGLHEYLVEQLSQLDNIDLYNPTADNCNAAFNVKKVFAQDAASYLSTKGICLRAGNHCAKLLVEYLKTDITLRASFYFYNTKEDVDALVEALKTTTIENCVSIIF